MKKCFLLAGTWGERGGCRAIMPMLLPLLFALTAGQAGQPAQTRPVQPRPAQPPAAAPSAPTPPVPTPPAPAARAQAQAPAQSEAAQLPVLPFEEALQQADVGNLDLQAARARLERAEAGVRQAWAGYLPSLTVGGSITRNNVAARIALPTGYFIRDLGAVPPGTPGPYDPSRGEPSPENPPGNPTSLIQVPSGFAEVEVQKLVQAGAQAELRQAVLAPTLWAAIHSANLGERSATLQVEAARRQVLFGAAQLYLGAAGLKEAVAVQERLLDIQREQTRLAEERFRAGTAPRLDVLRAQIDLARAEQDLVRTRNSLASARSSLATLLGRAPDFDVQGPEGLPMDAPGLPGSPDEAVDRARTGRPDLLAAQLAVEQARTVRMSVIYSYFPFLSLSAQYRVSNVTGFAGRPDTWAIIAGLNWTLWDGGAREAQLHAANAGIAEAQASARAAQLRTEDEVRRAMLELESARANREKARQQLTLAQENIKLVQLAYQAGAASSLDVSVATSQLAGAELGAINERVSAYLAGLSVLRAAGLFDAPSAATQGPTPQR